MHWTKPATAHFWPSLRSDDTPVVGSGKTGDKNRSEVEIAGGNVAAPYAELPDHFTAKPSNTFQGLIVDEAHRLNEKSGLFSNLGENPIKEFIDASTFSV